MRYFLLLLISLVNLPLLAQEDAERERLTKLAQDISKHVEEIRGRKFERPIKTAFVTRDQVAAKMRENFAEDYPDEMLHGDEAFLKIVGALPRSTDLKAEYIDVLTIAIGGFYEPEDKTFYIVDELAKNYGPLPLAVIIAHELTHALDDERYDLDKLIEPVKEDSDRGFAVASVIEGSATALMNRYLFRELEKKGGAAVGLVLFSAVSIMQDREALEKLMASPRFFQTITAPYTAGEAFLSYGARIDSGISEDAKVAQAVDRAVRDLPRSSEQILHPAKYWSEKDRDEPVLIDAEAMKKLLKDAGLPVIHEQTGGEMMFGLAVSGERMTLAQALSPADQWTNDAARGWGGDKFFLIESEDTAPSRRGVWVTLWDTKEDRDEFLGLYDAVAGGPDFEWFELSDRGAVVLFNIARDRADALHRLMLDSPPKLTKAGQPWPS